MRRQKVIQQKIELVRTELNKLAQLYGLQDKRVLEKSRELDQLLNVLADARNCP
ncbi:aspartyl-phosphate phosphatase Spo0E family protein [Paenibacillus senegalimassiliensis]|uniref:aspartyl-phosphate phosphatase Spo0E family protein n=1 Tax=Paenibacillus senegalimassiliensis TaxID=1737426 RepID=UPI0009E86917|nr:aspartyl-phosphate phosphatase Spo0E family protein [Paenibacillus senegalimassiliensis]